MNREKLLKRALAEAAKDWPGATPEEIAEEAESILAEWEREAAEDREFFGEPMDTPCLEDGVHNCDDAGTGEGRYHGRI